MKTATGSRDARAVDAYIGKARPFAQPVLIHIRELMHKASPDVTETVKWGMPFFELNGVILGNMAAFKEHCSLGLWGPEMHAILGNDGAKSNEAMGTIREDYGECEGSAGGEGAAGIFQAGGRICDEW